MEKQITDLSVFEKYCERQVVINVYEDEGCMTQRDGFYFERITVTDDSLHFIKKNESKSIVTLADFPIRFQSSEFQHYFIFANQTQQIEIYFP